GVQVTVFKDIIDSGQTGGQTGGQIGGQIGGQSDHLTERQKEVYFMIEANPNVSRKELAQNLGINESAVQKHLKALTDQQIIERVVTYQGHWKIIFKP